MATATATVYARIPEELKDLLDREAETMDRTMGAQLTVILRDRYTPKTKR